MKFSSIYSDNEPSDDMEQVEMIENLAVFMPDLKRELLKKYNDTQIAIDKIVSKALFPLEWLFKRYLELLVEPFKIPVAKIIFGSYILGYRFIKWDGKQWRCGKNG